MCTYFDLRPIINTLNLQYSEFQAYASFGKTIVNGWLSTPSHAKMVGYN